MVKRKAETQTDSEELSVLLSSSDYALRCLSLCLSMLDNDWGMTKFPFVPGHEVVGTVVALGDEAKGLKIGQIVGVGWLAHRCLSCHRCMSGEHHLCPRVQGTIIGRYGGFASQALGELCALLCESNL